MLQLTPRDCLKQFRFSTDCGDHHRSGPPSVWQAENNGSVFHIEGRILFGLAVKHGGPVLEIGADLGISTRYIHEGLVAHIDASPESSGPLPYIYSVDTYHKWEDDPFWILRVRVSEDSATYVPPKQCKWAFCDGDHRYDGVVRDIKHLEKLNIPLLVFHDTSPRFTGIPTNASSGSEARRAVTDTLSESDWDLIDVTTPCGLIIARKK